MPPTLERMYRIAVVCTGNICRSPMAEFMLREAFGRAGLGESVEVASAGTTSWEAGEPIDVVIVPEAGEEARADADPTICIGAFGYTEGIGACARPPFPRELELTARTCGQT